MAKKIKAIIKLYAPAGQANPAPPVGPALGQHGLNIMEFCKAFNEKTKDRAGLTLPVVITAYHDKSFSFEVKSPPASVLLKRACGIAKASGAAGKEKVGVVSQSQVADICKAKMKDLNTDDVEKAKKVVEGTARSMGIDVVEDDKLEEAKKEIKIEEDGKEKQESQEV